MKNHYFYKAIAQLKEENRYREFVNISRTCSQFPHGINNNNQKIGPERRQEILDGITDNGTFLPNGVLEEDMDEAVIETLNTDKRFYMSLDGQKVPVIFLTIQRWTEFNKNRKFGYD